LDTLRYNQKKLSIKCHTIDDYALCFKQLIEESYDKYQKPVVILIDEYDKPILDNLDQMEVAWECREILKRLYTQIKESDRYIKFTFLTGVSKFSKASIFSGLNNLEDISLAPRFGTICGYIQNDIETSFLPYLEGVDLDNLSLETIMFQSGYLTIKEVERLGNSIYYHLTYPNIEVKQSFNDYLLSNYFVNRSKKSKVQTCH